MSRVLAKDIKHAETEEDHRNSCDLMLGAEISKHQASRNRTSTRVRDAAHLPHCTWHSRVWQVERAGMQAELKRVVAVNSQYKQRLKGPAPPAPPRPVPPCPAHPTPKRLACLPHSRSPILCCVDRRTTSRHSPPPLLLFLLPAHSCFLLLGHAPCPERLAGYCHA